MEHTPQPYGVFIRTDAEGRIIAVNSSAFLDDASLWTKIDEGFTDKHHHAQNNYLPAPLTDDRGVCRYKLEDGRVVERTQTEMDADYAALPKPEQTNVELLLEMAADHEYRICLMELGVNANDL